MLEGSTAAATRLMEAKAAKRGAAMGPFIMNVGRIRIRAYLRERQEWERRDYKERAY